MLPSLRLDWPDLPELTNLTDLLTRVDPKIFGFGKSRKSRTNPKISIRDFVRKDIFRSLFVRIWSIRSFGNSRIPNPERSDYTNLMRNYEACKGAKIGSIRPEPINWSPGGYRIADKIKQTVSQSIHGWMKTLSRSFSVMSTRRLCFVAANENWLKSLNKYFRSGFRDFKLFRSGSEIWTKRFRVSFVRAQFVFGSALISRSQWPVTEKSKRLIC